MRPADHRIGTMGLLEMFLSLPGGAMLLVDRLFGSAPDPCLS